jgi:hypothetical protein
MTDVLGYPHFGAHGGDIGGWVTSQLGRLYPQQVIGIHVNGVCARPYRGPEARPLSSRASALGEGGRSIRASSAHQAPNPGLWTQRLARRVGRLDRRKVPFLE